MYRHVTVLSNLTHFGIAIFIFTVTETKRYWQNSGLLRAHCLSPDGRYVILEHCCNDNLQEDSEVLGQKPASLAFCPEQIVQGLLWERNWGFTMTR